MIVYLVEIHGIGLYSESGLASQLYRKWRTIVPAFVKGDSLGSLYSSF